jgi:hypothetical protein
MFCNSHNKKAIFHVYIWELLTCSALDDYWVARLGALRRGSSFPSPYEQLRPVSHIILHPGYVDAGFLNDISLLRLRDPVQFSDFVRPVCLPPAPIRDGRLCTVVGWGQLFEVGRIFRKSSVQHVASVMKCINGSFIYVPLTLHYVCGRVTH